MPQDNRRATRETLEARGPAYKAAFGMPVLNVIVDQVTGLAVGHYIGFCQDMDRERPAKKTRQSNA